jgi:hypothetical protein
MPCGAACGVLQQGINDRMVRCSCVLQKFTPASYQRVVLGRLVATIHTNRVLQGNMISPPAAHQIGMLMCGFGALQGGETPADMCCEWRSAPKWNKEAILAALSGDTDTKVQPSLPGPPVSPALCGSHLHATTQPRTLMQRTDHVGHPSCLSRLQ